MGGQQRHKNLHKQVQQFKLYFGFKEPHKILIDGTFLRLAKLVNMNIFQKFQKITQGKNKLCTTRCIQEEMKLLGQPLEAALEESKTYMLLRCTHPYTLPAAQCI